MASNEKNVAIYQVKKPNGETTYLAFEPNTQYAVESFKKVAELGYCTPGIQDWVLSFQCSSEKAKSYYNQELEKGEVVEMLQMPNSQVGSTAGNIMKAETENPEYVQLKTHACEVLQKLNNEKKTEGYKSKSSSYKNKTEEKIKAIERALDKAPNSFTSVEDIKNQLINALALQRSRWGMAGSTLFGKKADSDFSNVNSNDSKRHGIGTAFS